jgi:hypothetical protein
LSKVLRRKRIEINNYKDVWCNENGAHIILKIGWGKKKGKVQVNTSVKWHGIG